MKAFRLIKDGPHEGVLNMAVDEALLAAAHEENAAPVLRWYQWSEPTLSLGYFQHWDDAPADLRPLPRVRRSTGGGAILHADELTYSLVFPAGTWPLKSGLELVAEVHAAVAAAILFFSPQLGAATPTIVSNAVRQSEPFFCFERRSPNDLVAGADKIMGSAQRRQGGCLLQHGSIPLRGWDVNALADRISNLLADRWRVRFEPSQLTVEERRLADELAAKHRSPEWTRRR